MAVLPIQPKVHFITCETKYVPAIERQKRKQLPLKFRPLCKRRRVVQACATSQSTEPAWAVLVENDGCLVDVHADAHRVAFNEAFTELGLDCAHWTAPVYWDLLRSGDGSAQGLVAAWFATVGWPVALPTSERRQFAAKIDQIKQKKLGAMLMDGKVPLRAGAQDFLDQADADGAAIAIVTGTASGLEKIAMATSFALGEERTQKWPFFDCYQQPGMQGEPGSEDPEEQGGMSLHQSLKKQQAKACSSSRWSPAASAGAGGTHESLQMLHHPLGQEAHSASANAAPSHAWGWLVLFRVGVCGGRAPIECVLVQMKHTAAADFVRNMEGARWGGMERAVAMGLDPAMMAALKRAAFIQPEWLAAIAATMGAPVGRRVMLAASDATLQAAKSSGMHSVAVPPSLQARGIFPAADLQFDSFGHGGGITWPRLKAMLSQPASSRARRSI